MVDALLQIVRNDTYSPTVRVAAGRAGLEKLRSFRLELVVEQQIALACTVEELTNGQPSLNFTGFLRRQAPSGPPFFRGRGGSSGGILLPWLPRGTVAGLPA